MSGFVRLVLRVGVISVLAGGAVAVIAGPRRASAVLHQAHGKLMSLIDANIDDPIALREQLRELEQEYPARISQIRSDLAELHEQMRQIERDRAVAARVVALADADLDELEPVLAQAEAARGEVGTGTLVRVRFQERSYGLERARARAEQIRQTRSIYENRGADAEHDLGYLRQQAGRLEELLLQLETERAQFQTQIQQLDRQVDAISRNDRLIEMMRARQKTIEECSRYEVASLDQLEGRLAAIRSRQEAELDGLAQNGHERDYEDLARTQLERERHGSTAPRHEAASQGSASSAENTIAESGVHIVSRPR